jgi:hypothetical protein
LSEEKRSKRRFHKNRAKRQINANNSLMAIRRMTNTKVLKRIYIAKRLLKKMHENSKKWR